ncbi:MAG TPA: hypothetical protein VI792_05860, partial [Candidatus Eisenbacteria bacterium]
EERDHLRTFAARHPLGTLNVYAPRIDWLDVPGRPISLVIDRDGVVRDCFIGARSYAEFERAVTARLGAGSSSRGIPRSSGWLVIPAAAERASASIASRPARS